MWAYEQEEQKLLAKWQRIQQQPDGALAGRPAAGEAGSGNGSGSDCANGAADGLVPSGSADLGGGGSLDYMVPWHLPFHRLEAAAVAARTLGGAARAVATCRPGAAADDAADDAAKANGCTAGAAVSGGGSGRGGSAGGSAAMAGGSLADKPFARIDATKNTIVFER